MNIPISWVDLDMSWADVHIAPYDPYMVAIAEAIKERAIITGKQGNIDATLLQPNPMYDVNEYASDIQYAITLLIPEFIDPATALAWDESTILAAIGAVARISPNYYMTADWKKQQYDLLNQMVHLSYPLAKSYDITPYAFFNRKQGLAGTKAGAISDYNGNSFEDASVGGATILLLSVGASTPYVVRGYKKDLILTNANIPDALEVDIYGSYVGVLGGAFGFVPLEHALVSGVFYLEAEDVVWDGIAEQYTLTMPITPPNTVDIGMFGEDYNGIMYSVFKAVYEESSLNFKL